MKSKSKGDTDVRLAEDIERVLTVYHIFKKLSRKL
jgi:hypothetical protein